MLYLLSIEAHGNVPQFIPTVPTLTQMFVEGVAVLTVLAAFCDTITHKGMEREKACILTSRFPM